MNNRVTYLESLMDGIYLQGIPKTRMFVAQITQLVRRQRKTAIPLPPLPAPVLSPQAKEQNGAANPR